MDNVVRPLSPSSKGEKENEARYRFGSPRSTEGREDSSTERRKNNMFYENRLSAAALVLRKKIKQIARKVIAIVKARYSGPNRNRIFVSDAVFAMSLI